MEEYRFKYYYDDGSTEFADVKWKLKAILFEQAHELVTIHKLIDKIDVYKGTKLIATFYK